jgi:hypothetical protein
MLSVFLAIGNLRVESSFLKSKASLAGLLIYLALSRGAMSWAAGWHSLDPCCLGSAEEGWVTASSLAPNSDVWEENFSNSSAAVDGVGCYSLAGQVMDSNFASSCG